MPLRRRADLSAEQQVVHGQRYWVLRDPVSLRYYRLKAEEYAIFDMLDGQTSLENLRRRFEEQFIPQRLSQTDLQNFLGQMHEAGLLLSDSPGQGEELRQRDDKRRRQQLLSNLTNPLALKFPLHDPHRLLSRIYPYIRWLLSWEVLLAALMLIAGAIFLVTVRFESVRDRWPSFDQLVSMESWPWLIAAILITKVAHEFSHALVAHHYGCEIHEMGLLLLMFTPCLYVNVSDAWRLPDKWQRAAVSAAGIGSDLSFAAVATFVWWFTGPGAVNDIALRIMVLSSLGTILANGNPLMKFDGYYVLSDLVNIPNLAQKAHRLLNDFLGKLFLGLEPPPPQPMPPAHKLMLMAYSLAAHAYRVLALVGWLLILNRALAPYGMRTLSYALFGMTLMVVLTQPVRRVWDYFSVPGRWLGIKRGHAAATLMMGMALLAVFAAVPMPARVRGNARLQAVHTAVANTARPGWIEEVLVQPGARVEQGQILLRVRPAEVASDTSIPLDVLAPEAGVALPARPGGEPLRVGSYVGAQSASYRILVNGELEAVVALGSEDLPLVQQGQAAWVTLSAHPETVLAGVVTEIRFDRPAEWDAAAPNRDAAAWAVIAFQDFPSHARLGANGRARIEVAAVPWLTRVIRHVQHVFRELW